MALNKEKISFGLDFSDQVLRLVQLKRIGKTIQLKAFGRIMVPNGKIVEGEIQDEKTVIKLVKKLCHQAKGNLLSKNVVASLPERKSFIKVIELPKDSAKDYKAVKKQIPLHVPLNLEEIYFDYQELSNHKKNQVIIAATPKKIADTYTTVLEKAGLSPFALEIESVAISRSLTGYGKDKQTAKLIVDIGKVRSTFIVSQGETVLFIISNQEISGQAMTDTIAKELKLSKKEAEKAKIICGLEKSSGKGKVRKVLSPTVKKLKEKIREAISYYQNNFSGDKIDFLILCGGSSQLKGLVPELKENLSKDINKVFLAAPDNNFQSKKVSIPKTEILSYTTAIGLALRGANHD